MDEQMAITLRMSDQDADEQELDDLTRRLRAELLDLDVGVAGTPDGEVPAGAKAVVELAALGTLLVTLSQSTVVAALINAVSNWLGQRRQRTVKLEVDGDVLELSGPTTPEQLKLAEAWLQRRKPGDMGFAGKRHALIVANYDYQDPGLRALRAPSHDAEQLARVLRDPKIGGFDVRTLLNESAAVINEAVEDFFADRDPDELLLLHFSGHGVKDEDGELYFAAAATKLHRLGATAIAADFVNRRMNRSRSRRIVLLLDCCYAGAFGRGMVARAGTDVHIEEQLGGRGRAVITASSSMEYAFEGQALADAKEGAPSVFTSALVEGLDSGEADRDQDGYIGLDELYDYVYERVRQSTPNQTPGKWTFDVQGDLHIARRSKPVTTPAPLPSELREAIDHPLSGMRAGAVGELRRLLASRHEGLALAAKLALRHLLDDDSRKVASAAAAALGVAVPAPAAKAPVVAPPRDPVVPPPRSEPEAADIDSAAVIEASVDERPPTEPATPPPVAVEPPEQADPARWTRWLLVAARVLAATAAGLLAVGLPSFLFRVVSGWGLSEGHWPITFEFLLATGLIASTLILAAMPAGGRGRGMPVGLAFGATAGVIGLMATLTAVDSSYADRPMFWVTALGLSVAGIAVIVETLARLTPRKLVVNAACGLAALITLLIQLEFPRGMRIDDEGFGSVVVLAVLLGLLIVAAIRTVQRWRSARSRQAVAFGAAPAVLLLIAMVWEAGSGGDVLDLLMLQTALLAILVVDILFTDDHPLSTVAARLTILSAVLLLAPVDVGDDEASIMVLLIVAAAGCALAAHWQSRPLRSLS